MVGIVALAAVLVAASGSAPTPPRSNGDGEEASATPGEPAAIDLITLR